jgi:hypothetical protein
VLASDQFIPHEPGAPPHRPQVGAAALEPFDDSAPTAKTLSARAVFVEPHFGHAIASSELIDFTSFSNWFSHFLQTYS